MVSLFVLSVVDQGLESRSGQTKGYEIYLPHRWCNGYLVRLKCGRSWVRVSVGSNQRL
jgi:hypothetical protein